MFPLGPPRTDHCPPITAHSSAGALPRSRAYLVQLTAGRDSCMIASTSNIWRGNGFHHPAWQPEPVALSGILD